MYFKNQSQNRAKNTRGIKNKDKKEKYIIFFFFPFEKGFCILDYQIDNRSPPLRNKRLERRILVFLSNTKCEM